MSLDDLDIAPWVLEARNQTELRHIRDAGIHHVTFRQEDGLRGLALATASLVAAMPRLVEELGGTVRQRLAEVVMLRRPGALPVDRPFQGAASLLAPLIEPRCGELGGCGNGVVADVGSAGLFQERVPGSRHRLRHNAPREPSASSTFAAYARVPSLGQSSRAVTHQRVR